MQPSGIFRTVRIACPEIGIGSFRTVQCPDNWKEKKIVKLRLLF